MATALTLRRAGATVDVYAGPDHRAVLSTLMHYYGLPMRTLGGVTDSKSPDQQAAAEAALTVMTDAISGGHMIHDIGYLDSAHTGRSASSSSATTSSAGSSG